MVYCLVSVSLIFKTKVSLIQYLVYAYDKKNRIFS